MRQGIPRRNMPWRILRTGFSEKPANSVWDLSDGEKSPVRTEQVLGIARTSVPYPRAVSHVIFTYAGFLPRRSSEFGARRQIARRHRDNEQSERRGLCA